jgi:putative endonuclease
MRGKGKYYVYVVQCADGTLYTGIAKNVQQRIVEHNTVKRGAKYTRSRRPVALVYTKAYRTRGLALQAEYRLTQ